MTNFNLGIDVVGFEKRGLGVTVNEKVYSEMLDEFSYPVTNTEGPVVQLTPSPDWGASIREKARLYLNLHGNIDNVPGCDYDRDDKAIVVRASDNPVDTSMHLVFASLRWAADVTGEQENIDQALRAGRARMIAPVFSVAAIGAGLGFAATGNGEPALVGAAIGSFVGAHLGINDYARTARFTEWRRTIRTPDAINRFGGIVSYHAI